MNQNGFSRESNKKSYTSEKADHEDTKKARHPISDRATAPNFLLKICFAAQNIKMLQKKLYN